MHVIFGHNSSMLSNCSGIFCETAVFAGSNFAVSILSIGIFWIFIVAMRDWRSNWMEEAIACPRRNHMTTSGQSFSRSPESKSSGFGIMKF